MGIKRLYNDNLRKLPNEYGVDRSKVENYVPIDKLAITRRYLRYSITSASAPA